MHVEPKIEIEKKKKVVIFNTNSMTNGNAEEFI